MPGRTIPITRRRAVLLALVLAVACEHGGEPVHEPQAPPAPTVEACTAPMEDAVVARVGGEPVTASELDATMAIQLHDFDVGRHQLRAARLRELLLARVLGPSAAAQDLSVADYVRREAAAAGLTDAAFVDAAFARAGVTIDLAPPEPPVLDVSIDDAPARGPASAPVTIVVFCDFQSSYCRGMQPIVQRLLTDYPTQVRLVERNFPLSMHRDAEPAAEAAACARRQGAYWPYRDALLQGPPDLGRSALAVQAQRAGLDVARLLACLDAHEARADVAADVTEARRLGLSIVPTTFVDGRYLRGPQPYEALRDQVDAALRRRGLAVPPPVERTSTTTPARPGATAAAPRTAPAPAPTQESNAVPATSVTLSAAMVEKELADRPRLERDLEHPTADLGPGYEHQALVRVGAVPPGGLFQAMGLQPGDVVMRVDGTLLLDRSDAFFDALRGRPSVTVQVLRHGLPQTFEYSIR